MTPEPGSESAREHGHLVDRVESLAAWIHEIETRVRAAELTTGDAETARELRQALEALAEHDPKRDALLSERVDVLADRLGTLAETVSTTAAGLAGKDGQIAALRRELESGNTRIEDVLQELRGASSAPAVEELRRAVEALSTRPSADADGLDALNARIDFLTDRLDTLARTVATTASGLAGREGELAALRRKLEEDNLRVAGAISELRRTAGHEGLGERVDALARAVAATVDRLSDKELEVGTFRGLLEHGNARVDSVVVELRQSIATLGAQVETLGDRPPGADATGFEERVEALSEKVDALEGQLESLATAVESAAGGISERELELVALHSHVLQASGRVDAVVDELRRSVDTLAAGRDGSDPAVEARLESLTREVHVATAHLLEVETEAEARRRESEERVAELDRLLGAVAERLEAVERERDATAAEVARAAEAWAEERAWVRGQLEALSAEHVTTRAPEELEPLIGSLSARLDAMEAERAAVAEQIALVSETLDAEKAALRAELDELAGALAHADPGGVRSEPLLAELVDRLERVEHEGAALAAEIGRVSAFWSSELGSLEARLDSESGSGPAVAALSERLDEMERQRETIAGELARVSQSWESERTALEARLDEVASQLGRSGSLGASKGRSEEEVAQLRVLFDGLRMRLASSEKELAALSGSRDVIARLDELTSRLDEMEVSDHAVAPLTPALPGEGRSRLDLRKLELRLEHAEALARESRDTFLVQLERLASRMEWRLQRLESAQQSASVTVHARQPDSEGGQVVELKAREV